MDRVSLPVIAGSLVPFVGQDVAILTPLADTTIDAASVTVLTAPTGGSLVVQIRTATTLLVTVTLATGEKTNSWAGTPVAVASGTQLYVRVASLVGTPSDLSGYLAFDADVLLTSVARVKEFRGISGTDWDALLLEIVEAVSAAIEGWIGRPIVQRTFDEERYRGSGERELLLNGFPVIGTPVVRLDGTALTADVDFQWGAADGIVERMNGDPDAPIDWPSGISIEVDSVRGYTTVPTDLRLAATKQCVHEFHQTQVGGGRIGLVGSSPDRGGAAQFLAGGFLPEVLQVLNRYREVRVPWPV